MRPPEDNLGNNRYSALKAIQSASVPRQPVIGTFSVTAEQKAALHTFVTSNNMDRLEKLISAIDHNKSKRHGEGRTMAVHFNKELLKTDRMLTESDDMAPSALKNVHWLYSRLFMDYYDGISGYAEIRKMIEPLGEALNISKTAKGFSLTK